ncbi:amino acid transporter [Lepidopterella palustris CBS 459.81]|uniref:Amino acid transporter n=1 Tax=Lepidopterella palustris CBS 459.81 TaxID=1314670 RepID=A0A8E2EGW9_9PEZI|nr:amino acid transporter [Lepidopterella palustris CBS 459.81]
MADDKAMELTVQRPGDNSDRETGESISSQMQTGDNDVTKRLDRYITFKPAVAFGLTILSSWEGFGLVFGAALLNGGPTVLVWGTLIAFLGTSALALSLAELASITPTVGAQYRWTGLYAPKAMSPAFWSLMQGWLTVFAWISLCAAVPFVSATMVQGLIILNKDDYEPQRWHGTLLMWAYILIPVLCNIFARKVLVIFEMIGGVMHIVFFIVQVVTLVVMAPRSSASFVFTTSNFGLSGWESEGVQWCIGLLSIVSVLTGFDGVLHLSDEVKDAPRKVPRSMIWAVVINSVMALAFMICVLFCIGDVNAAVTSPTGYPIIEIYYQATKSKAAATVLTCTLLIPTMISIFGIMASVSRLAWAFARDKGLPFSEFFAYVHPTLRIPLNALFLVASVSALLGLINIGSTAAFYAILSLSALGLYLSYIIPIIFVLIRKFEGKHPPYGPFSLGQWGIPINIFALCWGIFMIIWLPFPATQPVTGVSMNYAGPIMIFVLFLALVDWFISGHKRFQVPTGKIDF